MKISGTKNKPSGLAGLCSWGEIHTSGRCNGHPRDQVTEMGMVVIIIMAAHGTPPAANAPCAPMKASARRAGLATKRGLCATDDMGRAV